MDNCERGYENDIDQHHAEVLQQIIKQEPHTIRAVIAKDALEYHSISYFFHDLMHHGCQSGMISDLIYYTETHQFFDKYYPEIETIRMRIEEIGIVLNWPDGDLKNHLSWLAYEETAKAIALVDLDL